MANDAVDIVGKWRFRFQKFFWMYTFNADGTCLWQDLYNNKSGKGRWYVGAKTLNVSWTNSTTKESWDLPISDQKGGWYSASYGQGRFTAEKVVEAPQADLEFNMDTSGSGDINLFTSPKDHPRYIENIVTDVGYGIYVGGFLFFCQGTQNPLLVPESEIYFGVAAAAETSSTIYNSRAEAIQAANLAGHSQSTPKVAYYWGGGGVAVCPTIFCNATTPQIIATCSYVVDKLVHDVNTELVQIAIGLVAGQILKAIMNGRISLKRRGSVPSRQAPEPEVLPVRTMRPRASTSQLRQMYAESSEYVSWGTTDPEVAANQKIVFTGQNTPPGAPKAVNVVRGLSGRGVAYGRFRVAVKISKVNIRGTPDAAEFLIDDGIPVEDSVWYTTDDIGQVRGGR